MKNETLSSPVALTLMSGPTAPLPLVADLVYDASDPYAVQAVFDTGAPDPVRWVFARDLLDEGVIVATGEGDVHVEPVTDAQGGRAVRLHLRSPEGSAQLDIAVGDVLAFLEATYEIVPPGIEDRRIDVDAAVSALLSL